MKRQIERIEEASRIFDSTHFEFVNRKATELETDGINSSWLQSGNDWEGLVEDLNKASIIVREKDARSVPRDLSPDAISVNIVKDRFISHLNDLLNSLKSMKGIYHTEVSTLEECKSQGSELCMSLSFIGPMKSGKSMTLNALLGLELAPSELMPCTVLPVKYRHVKGQIAPVLKLDPVTMKAIGSLIKKVKEIQHRLLNETVEGAGTLLNEEEVRALEGINAMSAELPSRREFGGIKGVSELHKLLSAMNYACRLYAKGKSAGFIEDSLTDPLSKLIKCQAWPQVEIEFEGLKAKEVVGNFEMIDTPGRDECEYIPIIKSIISSVLHATTAVVCVLDCRKALNDSASSIDRELRVPKNDKLPLYLLANQIDLLDEREKLRENDLFHEIEARFLGRSDRDEKQLYGVSAKLALNARLLERLEDQQMEVIINCLKNNSLPSQVKESYGVDDDMLFLAIDVLKYAHGTRWRKTFLQNGGAENLKLICCGLVDDSRFNTFTTKLMDELAPVSGQKILNDVIDKAIRGVKSIIRNLDTFSLGPYFKEFDEFMQIANPLKVKIDEATMFINKEAKSTLVKDKIEELFLKQLQQLESCLDQVADKVIKGHLKTRGTEMLRLFHPPTEEEIRKNQAKAKYKDTDYWEVTAEQKPLLDKFLASKFNEENEAHIQTCYEKSAQILREILREYLSERIIEEFRKIFDDKIIPGNLILF